MENQNQNTKVIFPADDSGSSVGFSQSVAQPQSLDSVSPAAPSVQTFVTEQAVRRDNLFVRLTKRADVVLAILLVLGSVGLVLNAYTADEATSSNAAGKYDTTQIPLDQFVTSEGIDFGTQSVIINGSLRANDGLIIAPTLQPTSAVAGQMYYDQTTNVLAYYNGTQFVPVSGASGVQSVAGLTGNITVGAGLSSAGGQLSNNGVLTVQGQAGNVNFTAGNGISIAGTTISNSGIVSVSSSSPSLTVTNDGNGNVTLGGSGAGTVSSSGGTVGVIPLFTASQNIEDSIVTQSGLTVTVSGDLAVVTGGLTLSNALTVSNGGTGAASLALNGVLVGQGTGPITSVVSGGAGLCLLSTAGAPTWSACPGGSGVDSLNGLTGALSIANASAAGSTITIDDASTVTKGIASFNAINFTAAGGAINTVQNINTGATPTFAGVNTNNITPSAALTVGVTGQNFTLQGSDTSIITAANGGNTTTVGFVTPGANVAINFPALAAGTYDLCTTSGNCLGGGGGGANTALSNLTGVAINTTLLPGVAGGVHLGSGTLPFGDLFLAGTSGTPGTNNFRITGVSTGATRVITMPDASGTVCLQSSTACGFASSATAFVQGGNSFGATAVLGTNDGNSLAFETSGAIQATIAVGGAVTLQNSTNSAAALQVQSASGAETLLSVDTTARGVSGGNLIKIGNSSGTDGATTILQLDGTTADPTSNLAALNGGLFYNSTTHKVSLIENGVVKIICNTTDLGCGTGTVTLQTAYANGNTISTTGNDIGFTLNGGQDFTVSSAAATSSVLFSGTTTTGTLLNLANATAAQTTATLLNVAQSGVTTGFTGNVVNLQGTSTTGTGTLLRIDSANTTNGNAVNVVANGLTTGVGVNINSTGAGLTTGSLLRVSTATTGAINTNGVISLQATGNYTSTNNNGLLNVLANTTTAGTIANIQGGALTTGVALNIGANTGTAIRVSSGLTSLTNATSGSGTTLTVNNSTSTGSIAVFQDNGTTVASIADGGATLFQNQTNSANAFRVLTTAASGSGETVGVDTTDSILRLLANNTGHLSGTGTSWNTASAMPAARFAAASVAVNGYVYNIGGCDAGSNAQSSVYYTRANSDGTLGTWATTTAMPLGVCGHAATTYNGYIYVNGSTGSATTARDVFYAKPNADGTISSWSTQDDPTNLVGLKEHGMAAYNGYLYITAGETDDGAATRNRNVYYGRIQADGSVPSFTVQTNWLTDTDNDPGQTIVANGFLYVYGSSNYDKFFYGRINNNGSVATVVQATGTTAARKYAAIVAMNGYMYAIAGGSSASATVQYGALANNGEIGAFTQDTTTLPASRWLCSKNAAVVNNYIYLFGCANASDVPQSTVYYASGTRVKVGASLDLVGYSGEGMSEGATGGQLTAGNTFVNGGLSVTGNTLLKDGAMVGNILTVNGTASVQTTTDSTTGFQVLNASSVPQFRIDTSNSRVYIGNPTADTTGALLILDTKSDSGDPTGINGGMYYNSNSQKFRCYQNSEWRDCVSSVEANGITNAAASGTQTTTTYANIPGTSSVNLTKKAATTKLVVNMNVSMFTNTAGSIVALAILVDGVDYNCGEFYFNPTGQHMPVHCSVIIPSLTAGAKTVQGRWKLDPASLGTPTLSMNAEDWTSITVLETD